MLSPTLLSVLAGMLLFGTLGMANAQESPQALNFKMKTIDGKEIVLGKAYEGKAVLFVNVASRCGYTRQYEGLQQLHEKFADRGLVIVGVPCNQFGGQEPGSEAEIKEFCQSNYGVEFAMLSKVDVKGDQQCDLYKYLTGLELAPKGKGPIGWNFEKILVDRQGKPVARFGSATKPLSDEMLAAIESALKAQP